MDKQETKPSAMDEFKEIFSSYPKVVSALENKLKEKEETLIDVIQINGDHLHYAILIKGPTYWYGILTRDKQGNKSNLTRICNYLGIEEEIRNHGKDILWT